jgi:MFS family permease
VGASFIWLIIGRAFQGLSAALIPVGMSIMRDELPKEKLGTAVALMSATLGIGGALGLPLAGMLYESLGWESIFWLSAAAGTLLMLAVMLVVPKSTAHQPGAFDYAGALVLSAALAALLLAVSKGGSWGWGSQPVLLLFLAAAILLAIWVPYELKVTQPMVNLRISVRRPVLMTNLASLLLGLAMFANMLLTTQQLQLPATTGYGLGLNVSVAGLCMVPSGLAMVVFAPLSGRIIRAFGGKVALITGAAVMIVGYVGRIFFYDSVTVVIIGATVVSIGTAVGYAAAPALIMGAVPVTETASANGLNSLLRSIGSSISSAVIGAVLATATMMVGSTLFPSFEAFRTLFLMAALASAASALAAVFIPKTATGSGARLLDGEDLRTGRAGTPSDTPSEAVTAPAGVTLLQTR